jgi:hypothetical protein
VNVNKQLVRELSIATFGACVGTGVTYILTKNAVRKRAEAEIESVKAAYKRINKEGEFATPGSALNHLKEAVAEAAEELEETEEDLDMKRKEFDEEIRQLGYDKTDGEHETPDSGEKIGPYTVTGPVDVPAPLALPDEMAPHVITIDQWSDSNYDHFDKISIMYYEGDETLVDERDEIIPDINKCIGDAFLHFGEGSDDPEQVYVRNGNLRSDFEVTRSADSYSRDVLRAVPRSEG